MRLSRCRALSALLLNLLCSATLWAQSGAAVDSEQQHITLALATEPPTLNATQATNSVSAFVLGHVLEGLLQYNEHNQLVGAVAERWQLDAQGARFWLRRDARWSDGRAVRAQDFVFGWRQVVAPGNASAYAFILYPVLNAEKINRGEMPAASLGVRAVSDFELEVRFERPCPYFLSLTAFMSYLPQREDSLRQHGQRFAAEADTQLYNGPFVLERWVHGAELALRKNDYYWDRARVRLQRIAIPYITSDSQALFNLFRDQRIALTGLDKESLGEAMAQGFALHTFYSGAQYFLELNFRPGHITANRHFRRALQALFDPQTLVNKVLGTPGNRPGYSLFPLTVKGERGRFRDEYPVAAVQRGLGVARAHWRRAQAELGEPHAPLVILASDNGRAAREAQYLQYLLQQGLGVPVKIDTQMFKQYLEKMRRGEFDIALAGWGPDFDDAMTYADLFASWNENNRGQYRSEAYDAAVRRAQSSTDARERMQAFAEIQQRIIDDVVIIPSFESGALYVQQPRLHGVQRRQFGADPDYRFAWVE